MQFILNKTYLFTAAVATVATSLVIYPQTVTNSRWYNKARLQWKMTTMMKPQIDTSLYVRNKLMENTIRRALFTLVGGVYVMYAPSGTGKTTTARSIIAAMQQNDLVSGAIWLDPSKRQKDDTLMKWFKREAGITCDILNEDELFPPVPSENKPIKPVVLLIDPLQFPDKQSEDMWKLDMLCLADRSVMRKRYIVLVLTNDINVANKILSCGPKIQPCKIRDEYKLSDFVGLFDELDTTIALREYKKVVREFD